MFRDSLGDLNSANILFLYLLFSIIITFPLLLLFRDHVVGDMLTDLGKNGLWIPWWIGKSLSEEHVFPMRTWLFNYPQGAALYVSDPLTGLMAQPFLKIFSFATTYNLLFLANCVFGAFAGYLLVFYLTGNRVAAFVSGIIFGFAPNRFTTYIDGLSEWAHVGWIPLYLLYLLKTYREKAWENSVIAGILFFITSFSNWYFAWFILVLSLLVFIYEVAFSETAASRRREVVFRTFILFLIAGFLLFPFVLAQYSAVNWTGEGETIYRVVKSSPLRGILLRRNCADLLSFFSPGKGYNPYYPQHQITYIGWIALLLAASGAVVKKGREGKFWLLVALFLFTLTIGPVLKVGGQVIVSWNLMQNHGFLPYGFLSRILPMFSSLTHPYRFGVMLMLAISVLAGFALALGFERLGDSKKVARAGILLGFLILLENMFISPLPRPFPLAKMDKPLFYQFLATEKENFAVLDFPGYQIQDGRHVQIWPRYFYYQTIHGKNIPYNLSEPRPEYLSRNPFTRELMSIIDPREGNPPGRLEDFQRGIDDLRNFRFKYLVIHSAFLVKEVQEKLIQFVGTFLHDPMNIGEMTIFKIY